MGTFTKQLKRCFKVAFQTISKLSQWIQSRFLRECLDLIETSQISIQYLQSYINTFFLIRMEGHLQMCSFCMVQVVIGRTNSYKHVLGIYFFASEKDTAQEESFWFFSCLYSIHKKVQINHLKNLKFLLLIIYKGKLLMAN